MDQAPLAPDDVATNKQSSQQKRCKPYAQASDGPVEGMIRDAAQPVSLVLGATAACALAILVLPIEAIHEDGRQMRYNGFIC